MNNKKYLAIGLIIVIVFGMGCIDNTSSGTDKDEQINKPINEPTTVMPTVMITDIKTLIQTTSRPTVTATVSTKNSDRYVTVTKIVDGDTIWIDNNENVRFVGINTPEVGEPGYYDATQYVSNRILNKRIYMDIDDKNPKDKYNRTLAVININGDNLNQELLCKQYAEIMYIPPSEFDPYSWESSCPVDTTPTYTNTPTSPQTSTPTSCDPSYPDFCIPPPPPDLNCDDIPQKNFKVLSPDPHGFDKDKDGIGCEKK